VSRRSGAIFLIPLLGIAAFAVLSFRDGSWGPWPWVVDLLTGSTVLTGPVTAACAAHLTVQQSRLRELTDTTIRGWWVPFRCAAQALLWGLVTYAATAVVVLLACLLGPHGGAFDLWAGLIGVAVLLVCALAGVLAGVLWPHRISVVAVGPAIFLLGAFGDDRYADLLRHGPSTASLAGLEVAPAFWTAQLVALLAIALALAAGIRVRADRRAATLVVLGLTLAAVVAAGTAIGPADQPRGGAAAERPPVCRGGAPMICLSPSSRRSLDGTVGPMRRAARVLAEAGVELPDRYEELLPGYRPPRGVGYIDVDVLPDPVQAGALNITDASACPAWFGDSGEPPPANGVGEARYVLQQWIIERSGRHVTLGGKQAQAWIDDAGSPAALAWVRRTFAQLRACDLGAIQLPYPDETS